MKRTEWIKWIAAELILCLLCCGCGKQEMTGSETLDYASEQSPETICDEKAEDNMTEKMIIPCEKDSRLDALPLLEWTEEESTNLADLLQREGHGLMVQLQAGSFYGSGVIYDAGPEWLTILTASHVITQADSYVFITFSDGFGVVSREYTIFEEQDVAVVRVPVADIGEEHLSQYLKTNLDKEAFDELSKGDTCIAMGSKSGVAEEAYEGTILDNWIYMTDYDQYMIWAKGNVMPGMSGGGLFDNRGRFLGILSGMNEEGELAVIPLSVIWSVLEDFF